MSRSSVALTADVSVSPTYVPDLWHLANAGAVTWSGFARRSAAARGLRDVRVEEVELASLSLAAPRPPYSVLGSARFGRMPPLEGALERWAAELEVAT
jgi:dTDP-4-dehydrorhamnose reductase